MNIKKVVWGIRAIIYQFKFNKIGMPSYLGKPIFISNGNNITCGKRVRIYPGLRAELVDNNSYIVVGNNVSIGQNFHVVSYNDTLEIGDDVTISGNVLITNCDHSYQDVERHILDQPLVSKHTNIGTGCFVGYGSVIQAGTILGKHCIVGANAVVRGEFPDNSVIVGSPAKVIKIYDKKEGIWKKV